MTQPFVITCETCQTKLRVRSSAAIGAILACPKCQSLVHVVPPEPAPAESSGAVDGAPGAQQPVPSGAATGRSMAMKVMLGGAGLVLAMGAAILLALSGATPPGPGGLQANAAPNEAERRQAADAGGDAPAGPESSPATSQQPHDPAADRADAVDSPASSSDAAATDLARPPALPEPNSTDRAASDSDGERTDNARSQSRVPQVGVPELDFNLTTEWEAKRPLAGGPSGPADQDPPEANLDRAASGPQQVQTPEVPTSSIPRMNISRTGGDVSSGEPPSPGQALSLPLAEMALEDTSPVELVRLIGNLTGAAITFTPEAYVLWEQSPKDTSSAKYARTTAGEVLMAALAEHGLQLEQHGQHVLVSPGAAGGRVAEAGGRQGQAPSDALQRKLQHRLTYSFTQTTTLAEVLRYVEHATEVTLLVDWESLATVDLRPTTAVTSSVLDQPLQEVLDGLLTQLNVDWTAVGDSAIWLTARRRH